VAKIILRDYQKDAVKLALNIKKCLHLIETGQGKTIISIFLIRYLLKNNLIDKVVVGATVSSTNPFIKDFSRKVNYPVKLIENVEDFKQFIEGNDKIIIIKHSLIEEIGLTQEHIDYLEDSLTKNYQRMMLVVDEAHELNNYDALIHSAFQNIRFAWERILLMTATPWSSKLEQIYGLVCLLHPKLWKSLKEFKNLYIIEEVVKDWKTGKYLRTEPVEYINIPHLRKTIEPFTFFYYPKIDLNYYEYKVPLEDYSEFDKICSGESLEVKRDDDNDQQC